MIFYSTLSIKINILRYIRPIFLQFIINLIVNWHTVF